MSADNNSKHNSATNESDIEIIVEEEIENNNVNKKYIISDADTLYRFIKNTLELRELVKCPLCLDVMKKPVEISCSHCFCEECLDTFFEEYPDKPMCPVCRHLINKRSQKANESLLGYISFVNDVNKELQSCFDCEVTELGSRTKINKKLGVLPKTPRKRAVSESTGVSDVIPGTIQTPKKRGRPPKQHKQNASATVQTSSNSHQTGKRLETSVAEQKIKKNAANKQTGTARKRSVSESSAVSDVIPGTVQATNKQDRSPKQHKQNISTPVSQQKSKKNANPTDSIIHWLTDNKNKFDKITQTQQSISSRCSQESFDMPSVSQIKNKKLAVVANQRPRSTSLSVENEIIYQEPRVRHNSWPSGNGKLNNFLTSEECLLVFLEETRKTAELRQKEEEFLNSIESELEMQKKMEEPQQVNKKRKRKSEKVVKNAKKFNLNDSENVLVQQKNLNENLSKTRSNDVGFNEVKKPTETTVVVLEQNNTKKTSPTVQNNLDDDYIFQLATQKIPSPQKQNTDADTLFIELQNCIEKIQILSSDSGIIENCRLLKHYAAKIEGILRDEKHPKSFNTFLAQNSKHNTTDVETQTDKLVLVDSAIQADEKQNQPSTPSSTVLSEPFHGSLISRLVQKYGKEESPNEQLKEISQNSTFDKITFNTQDLKNSSKPPDEANQISNTLDNIDFDTQQLVQKYNKLLSNDSSQKSGKRNSISKRLDYSENHGESQKKRFKRIRAPSDSDSDSEVHDKKRNKYLQEDISVQFESEVPVATNTNTDEEFRLSDDASYSVFVDKILKKYDKPPASTQFEKPKTNKPLEKSTTNKLSNVIETCERIIQQVEKHTVTALQISQNVADNGNSKSQKERHVFSSDETFNDEDIMNAIDRDIEEVGRLNVNGSNNKQKGFSESQVLSKSRQAVGTKNGHKAQNSDTIIELNDSFDEEIALLEPENDDVTVVENKRNGIKVLHDVKIKPVLNDEEIGASDEEIFSDIDVVENTPPRNLSQFNGEPLDVILPPPPEFQEEINSKNLTEFNTEQDLVDKTLTEHMKIGSPTPDFLSPAPPLRMDRIRAMGTSTPISGKAHSEKSLNLSPIAVQRNRNPFEAAKSHKETPLTVVANTPPPIVVVDRKIVDTTSKQQQSILNYVRPVTQENVVIKKPCITCSRLEDEHMIAVSALAKKKLADYTSTFGPNVTHVVVAVNAKNCIKDHTMKYVCGVAAGIWIVSVKWVHKCLALNKIVPEEPYEVKDLSGVDGPRQSRLTRTRNPLLRGFKIYAAPPFLSTTPSDAENVVKMLGGIVVSTPGALSTKQGHICVIISEASATQDLEIYQSWLETFKVITVDIEWLSRSVGQYKVMSLRPFALCSEDSLDNLGYPEDIISSMYSPATDST